MHVREVMSVRLVCAREDAPIKELARRLVRNRIGGMPVVDDQGRIRGIVSESDLHPLKAGKPSRDLITAADVMTTPVVTLTESHTVTQAARVLRRHGIKRAPVVREGRVVGMVTQSDLLRPYLRTDTEIRAEVEEAMLDKDVGGGALLMVSVHGGVVMLRGTVDDPRQAALLARVAGAVDGVVDVRDLTVVAQLTGPPQ